MEGPGAPLQGFTPPSTSGETDLGRQLPVPCPFHCDLGQPREDFSIGLSPPLNLAGLSQNVTSSKRLPHSPREHSSHLSIRGIVPSGFACSLVFHLCSSYGPTLSQFLPLVLSSPPRYALNPFTLRSLHHTCWANLASPRQLTAAGQNGQPGTGLDFTSLVL